jgi:superfamily II DNA or RNA helicase
MGEAMQLQIGSQIRHPRLGLGILVALQPDGLALGNFIGAGYQPVVAAELEAMASWEARLDQGALDPPLETTARLLAHAIQSVQQTWGVFSRSRIQLLPHQLWVCRKVLEAWPPRWLVADDVGLGKTIEAGLVMKALQARGRLNRFLVLCPASLVPQWQARLRTMFAINTVAYAAEQDQPETGFWDLQCQVVASLHTLRLDHQDRHDRLLQAKPWDLVVVDEAHHLGDQPRESTLAFSLVKNMNDAERIRGLVLFTGTPHKGVDYSFLALLNLLRNDLFDPERPMTEQLEALPKVVIRNSKANARDLHGDRLFHGTSLSDHTFAYSEAEQAFYDRLSAFIREGLLYGQGLGESEGRAVNLVLITFQKLAASSVAAVHRALQRRLSSLRDNQERFLQLEEAKRILESHPDAADNPDFQGDLDGLVSQMELLEGKISLVANEVPFLEELIRLAGQVQEETKLVAILELLERSEAEGGLGGRTVLFFTEYKATQSLLMGLLKQAFGNGSTGFINGDERALGVTLENGQVADIAEPRETASGNFNRGIYQFLVSTEAAGEGIDLQANCHTLIHVDMPWNPMRMHQRVGRLYRYGQTKPVEVHTFRNPGTVESRIYELLQDKLRRISTAFAAAAEDPEDLLQVVLGVVQPGFYEELARKVAAHDAEESVSGWIEQGFGGEGVIKSVQNLLGHVAQFDFQGIGTDLPRVDLPDLKPFFMAALAIHGREWNDDGQGRGTFRTPEAWMGTYGIRDRYEHMAFARGEAPHHQTLGADYDLFTKGLQQILGRSESLAAIPQRHWSGPPLLVYRIHEQVEQETAGPDLVVGLQTDAGGFQLLRDWEVIKLLSPVAEVHRSLRQMNPVSPERLPNGIVEHGIDFLREHPIVRHSGFPHPGIQCLGILLPESRASNPVNPEP